VAKTILEWADQKIATANGCGLCCTVSTSGTSKPPVSGPLPALLPHPHPQQGPVQKVLLSTRCVSARPAPPSHNHRNDDNSSIAWNVVVLALAMLMLHPAVAPIVNTLQEIVVQMKHQQEHWSKGKEEKHALNNALESFSTEFAHCVSFSLEKILSHLKEENCFPSIASGSDKPLMVATFSGSSTVLKNTGRSDVTD